MKINLLVFTCTIFFMIFLPPALADDKSVESSDSALADELSDEFTIEMLYKHFESHYTPKDLLHKAQKEAMYIAGEFKKSEQAGIDAVNEFNQPFTRWNEMDGLHPFSQIHNTEKTQIEAHPNPALKKVCKVEGLLLEYKDHAGRLVGIELLSKTKNQPKGAWIFQFTTWIKSITKVSTPFYNFGVFVAVPGTTYVVLTVMPYRTYSHKEMDTAIDYFDSMVEFWSIME